MLLLYISIRLSALSNEGVVGQSEGLCRTGRDAGNRALGCEGDSWWCWCQFSLAPRALSESPRTISAQPSNCLCLLIHTPTLTAQHMHRPLSTTSQLSHDAEEHAPQFADISKSDTEPQYIGKPSGTRKRPRLHHRDAHTPMLSSNHESTQDALTAISPISSRNSNISTFNIPLQRSTSNPFIRLWSACRSYAHALILSPLLRFFEKTDFLSSKKLLCLRCVSPRQLTYAFLLYATLAILFALYFFIIYLILSKQDDSSKDAEPFSRVLKTEILLPPQGPVFALIIQVFAAYLFGWSLNRLLGLPALLGMLLVGFALRNIPYVSQLPESIPLTWSSTLRSFALGTILLKAGLGLNLRALIRLGRTTLMLATIPNLVECLSIAIPSKFLLDIPFIWAFMLGFIMVSVSPAVVVPSMVSLQERGLGVEKGIPSMVLGAASLDDVLAIAGFSILLSIAFQTTGSLALLILHAPIEVCSGILGGILLALILWPLTFFPSADGLRGISLFGVALCALYGGQSIDYSGSGTLAVMVMGTCVAKLWSKEQLRFVSQLTKYVWVVAQPLLFSLIGSQIVLSDLKLDVIGYGVVVIIVGLLFRLTAVFIISCCCCSSLNLKESIFLLSVFLPKATVQAAIGPIPLSMALERYDKGSQEVKWSESILALAVLTILLTAPLGAVLINFTGPILLKKKGSSPPLSEESDNVEEGKGSKGLDKEQNSDQSMDSYSDLSSDYTGAAAEVNQKDGEETILSVENGETFK